MGSKLKLGKVTKKYVEIVHPGGSVQRYTWKGLEKAARLSAWMQKLLNEAEDML